MDLQYIAKKITEYLLSEGYKFVVYKGGTYYRRRTGLFSVPQYVKFKFETGKMTMTAFIKLPILPFVSVGEMGIEGSFCTDMKISLVRDINNIETKTKQIVMDFRANNPGLMDYPDITFTMG